MLSQHTLNQMNEDELRSYIQKHNDLFQAMKAINIADGQLIENLEQLCKHRASYKKFSDQLIVAQFELGDIEQSLESKYPSSVQKTIDW